MIRVISEIVLIALVVSGAGLAIGCESSDDGQLGPPEEIAALHPGIRSGWEGASQFQKDLLRDGDLTFAEYERAVHATVQCIQEAVLTLRGELTYDSTAKRFDYSVDVGPSGGGVAVMDDCWMEHQACLDSVWEQINLVPVEQRLAAADAMVACLTEAGFSGMPQPDTEDFLAWSQAQGSTADIADCAMQTRDEFSVWFGY